MNTEQRDRGSLSVIVILLTIVCLSGAALIVDGGRALAARRHAANTAEASARYAVSTQSIGEELDTDALRARAVAFANRAGVPSSDVTVEVHVTADGPTVRVTITERTTAVFLALGGTSTMTVHATGVARYTYSS